MATAFSPSIYALTPTGITVGGTGNLTVTSTASGPLVTRSLNPKFPSVPIYAEFYCTTASSTSGQDCVGLQFTGNNVPAEVIGVCIDVTNGYVWTTVDGSAWNGGTGSPNPATGTHPNIYTISGAMHFALGLYSQYGAATINFGQSSFAYNIPSGFSAWGATETLDPTHAGSAITIGPDNVTAYGSGSGSWYSVLSTGSKTSGKFYLEIQLYSQSGGPNNNLDVGFGNISTNLSSYPGADGNSCGYLPSGAATVGWSTVYGFATTGASIQTNTTTPSNGALLFFSNGNHNSVTGAITTGGLPTWTSGSTIGIALHPTYGAFLTVDGTNWNKTGTTSGDPVAGTGGFSIPAGAVQFLIENGASGSVITLNPTGSFTFPIPSGYVPWDATPPTPVAQLPTPQGRLQRTIAAFFPEPMFAGRKLRPVALTPAPTFTPAKPNPNGRLQRTIAAFFPDPPFAGRNVRRPAIGPVPPPPPPAQPYNGMRRQQATIATFFPELDYPGRRLPNPYPKNYGGGVNLPARASQIVVEGLVRGGGAMRASQIVAEGLVRGGGAMRASQVVAEALVKQDNPSFVRASQIVVEVLVPYVEQPVVPVYPELPGLMPTIIKRPKFSTGVGVGSSGREVRVGYWSKPQWEWDLQYDILGDGSQWKYQNQTSSDLKTLMGFVLYRFGAQAPFYFRDPDDYAQTGQVLGIGDGNTTKFYFQRTYGVGDFSGTENVGGVNTGETIALYLNNVEQSTGFTLNTSTPCGNYVQFSSPPGSGVVVTADFQFWYYTRFKDDSLDFEKFMTQLWDQKKLTIFSLKN